MMENLKRLQIALVLTARVMYAQVMGRPSFWQSVGFVAPTLTVPEHPRLLPRFF